MSVDVCLEVPLERLLVAAPFAVDHTQDGLQIEVLRLGGGDRE
jgi:hypothetical protein